MHSDFFWLVFWAGLFVALVLCSNPHPSRRKAVRALALGYLGVVALMALSYVH